MAEGVVAVLEVKSDISAQWSEIEATVNRVKQLCRHYGPGIFRGGLPSPQIPVFAVGYTGYKSIQTIKRRLASTAGFLRPEGVLVLEPGVFVSKNLEATGPLALYGLIAEINALCIRLVSVVPDLFAYTR